MNEATARPWRTAGPNNSYIVGQADTHIAVTIHQHIERHLPFEANAALIVKAVNAHDALVAALETIQVQTQDPAIERLCAAALPGAQR